MSLTNIFHQDKAYEWQPDTYATFYKGGHFYVYSFGISYLLMSSHAAKENIPNKE